MDGSSLLLPNPVPLPAGNTSQYYSITWINGTSFTLDMSSSKYSLTQNGSLNVHELEEIDSGQYSLKINVTNPVANSFFVYMNSSYRIHVQGEANANQTCLLIQLPYCVKIKTLFYRDVILYEIPDNN